MDYLDKARRVLDIERNEIGRLRDRLGDSFNQSVAVLREALDRDHKIVVLGVGKSGHIGEKIAATLTSTGSRAVILNSLNALHGDLGIVRDGDAVLALSYSGETDELLAVLPALSRFDVKIVALTGNAGSALARFSSAVLDVSVGAEACPLGLAPTSSTTVMLALGDAIAMVLLEARGFGREDFAKFHPAGRLGRRLLLKASDVMRKGERLPVCREGDMVRVALGLMTSLRCGAVVVAAGDGSLAGIFTQGDFARKYQDNAAIGERTLAEVMTRNPVSIADDQPAVEILKIIEGRKIDDIIVVNKENRPVGLVDSQDLSKFQLL